jgi:signal transduction histidine kinase/ligand-binding sensor domain-containing protein
LLASTPATALDATRSMEQMIHRAYTRDDGLPGHVHAISQSPDGYLWIGTDSGLYRFDGVRFESMWEDRLSSRGVLGLRITASGDLWLAFAEGGLSRLRNGAVTSFATTAEGSELRAQVISEVPKGGGLWALGGFGPYRFDGRVWREVPGPWVSAAQGGGVWSTEPGHDGTLWAKNGDGVFYCRPGCSRFVTARGYAGGVMGFTHDRDGRVWTSDSRAPGRMYMLPDLAGASAAAIPAPTYGGLISQRIHGRIFLDKDGTLWSINVQHGLLRVRSILAGRADVNQADAYTAASGLSSDTVTALYEDREGSIWVGTYNGLDCFRPANVVLEKEIPVISSRYGYTAASVGDTLYFYANTSEDNNSPVASTSHGPLYRVNADGSVELVVPKMELAYAMRPAADGGLWIGLSHGLYKLQNKALIAQPMPASLAGDTGTRVLDVAETSFGDLWMSTFGHGLWRRTNGTWSRIPGRPDQESPEWTLAFDKGDVLWLVDQRTIARYENGRLVKIPNAEGPKIGAIETISAGKHGMLFGGEFGLARYDGRGFQTLRSERVPALADVSGIAEADGQTWIASQAGILRFDTAALERALLQSTEPPPSYELFDRLDGVSGAIQQGPYSDTATTAFAGPAGRIWFLTDRGIVWLDPHHIYRNTIPPSVTIRSLTIDGRTYGSPYALDLPAGARELRIDYTATSLQVPERVRFRYVLEGFANRWTDAGNLRQAFFTNLPPGRYRFHVVAANNDGVWNTAGASVSFVIPPTFLQSWYFVAICGLTGAVVLWALYRIRLQQMAGRVRSRLEERVRERERIARELHDTLLQSVQGLVLRFHAAVERMQADDPCRQDLARTIQRADHVLIDARERVRHLRTTADRADLPVALREAGEELGAGRTANFRMIVEGTARELHAIVCEELIWVGREALTNAFTHADAHQVVVEISYHWRELRLQLWDDGRGMPEGVAVSGARAGHFGLVGIRERVKRVRGRLTLQSKCGCGTALTVVLPAAVAYEGNRQRWSIISRIRYLFAEEIET